MKVKFLISFCCLLMLIAPDHAYSQTTISQTLPTIEKMKIEIWSDIMCPFCYLGKRKLELALEQFEGRDRVEIVWKSFQLNPDVKTDTTIRVSEYLSKEKGVPESQALEWNRQLTESGSEVGLTYHFDRVVVSNTFKAHNLLHYAKAHGKQNEAGERLFRAHFTECRNVDDMEVLKSLCSDVGLDPAQFENALINGTYAEAVRKDISEAEQLRITGVPFFVFNRKYAISGAQDVSVFLKTLQAVEKESREAGAGSK